TPARNSFPTRRSSDLKPLHSENSRRLRKTDINNGRAGAMGAGSSLSAVHSHLHMSFISRIFPLSAACNSDTQVDDGCIEEHDDHLGYILCRHHTSHRFERHRAKEGNCDEYACIHELCDTCRHIVSEPYFPYAVAGLQPVEYRHVQVLAHHI